MLVLQEGAEMTPGTTCDHCVFLEQELRQFVQLVPPFSII